MINITGCNIQCPMGDFEDAIRAVQDKQISVIISNCNITLVNNGNKDDIANHVKNYYRMALTGNTFIDTKGNVRIEAQEVQFDDPNGLGGFIYNLVRFV